MKTLSVQLVLASALFALAGCSSVYITTKQELGVPAYAATDPARIEILHAVPAREHVRLAEIRAEPASESVEVAKIEASLRETAAKLGADAIVILSDKIETTGASVTGDLRNRSVQTNQSRVIVASAIKYK